MIKKLAALAGASALLLGAAVPAFASWGGWSWGSRDVAIVGNSATAVADTGGNSQGNFVVADDDVKGGADVSGNNDMDTGDADATAKAVVIANTHVGCGCESRGHKDIAIVGNEALAAAYTGDNDQGNFVAAGDDVGSWWGHGGTSVSGNNDMDTGDADATAKAFVLVNTHVDELGF